MLDQQDRGMKSLELEGKVVTKHIPKIETSVPEIYTDLSHSNYLGGESVHVCIPLCTHVYIIVYTRVHYLALSISPVPPSSMSLSRPTPRHSRD